LADHDKKSTFSAYSQNQSQTIYVNVSKQVDKLCEKDLSVKQKGEIAVKIKEAVEELMIEN